jgi:hypothetical protein
MADSLINLSKQDILYIIERLNFDEISVPRALLMSEDFDPLNLLLGFLVAEAWRKHQDDGAKGRGNTFKRDTRVPPPEGRRMLDDTKAEALKQRWQSRRYDALCSIDSSIDLESEFWTSN